MRRSKKKLYLILMILIISSGILIFFIINLFEFFGMRELILKTNDDYTISYPQGSGSLNVDFKLTHERDYRFNFDLTYIITSTGNVEGVGITYYELFVLINGDIRRVEFLNLSQPSTYFHNSFSINYIYQDDIVECTGNIDVQFLVDNVTQNENINFNLDIIIPTDPAARLFEIDLTLIWIEVIFIVVLGATIIYIARTIKSIQYERKYTDEDRKRDEEFFEFLKKGVDKQKD